MEIKNYEDACKALGIKPKHPSLLQKCKLVMLGKRYRDNYKRMEAEEKLMTIQKALNRQQKEWEPSKYLWHDGI